VGEGGGKEGKKEDGHNKSQTKTQKAHLQCQKVHLQPKGSVGCSELPHRGHHSLPYPHRTHMPHVQLQRGPH